MKKNRNKINDEEKISQNILPKLQYLLLKNRLYSHASAIFPTSQTTNQIIGKITRNKEFADQSSEFVIHQIDKVHSSSAATHTHTIHHIINFPKNDPKVTSLGALSNNETSGFLFSDGFSQI